MLFLCTCGLTHSLFLRLPELRQAVSVAEVVGGSGRLSRRRDGGGLLCCFRPRNDDQMAAAESYIVGEGAEMVVAAEVD